MADHTGLRIVGCIFGGVTAAVTLIACAVVLENIDAPLVPDTLARDIKAASVATLRHR